MEQKTKSIFKCLLLLICFPVFYFQTFYRLKHIFIQTPKLTANFLPLTGRSLSVSFYFASSPTRSSMRQTLSRRSLFWALANFYAMSLIHFTSTTLQSYSNQNNIHCFRMRSIRSTTRLSSALAENLVYLRRFNHYASARSSVEMVNEVSFLKI